jgi:hypothetical protein
MKENRRMEGAAKMRSFIICTYSQTLGRSNQGE